MPGSSSATYTQGIRSDTLLVGTLVTLGLGIGTASSWQRVDEVFGWLTPFLAAGFGAQVLLGALSYLVPVALGGGPTPVRAANAVLDRGAPLRLVVANVGLLLCALPVPSGVRVLASTLVLGALASILPLLPLAVRASRRAKANPSASGQIRTQPPAGRPAGQVSGFAVTGLAAVAMVVAAGVAVDPAAVGPRRRSRLSPVSRPPARPRPSRSRRATCGSPPPPSQSRQATGSWSC